LAPDVGRSFFELPFPLTGDLRLDVQIIEPVEAAKAVGLRYISDAAPGIRRVKRGAHFAFVAPSGKPIRNEAEIERIRTLAIPPAYTDVWISPDPKGHLQATGRDARGRKQYRYHRLWREVRDENKFERMVAFANALPAIRAQVERDMALPELPRDKVLAALVSLLEATLIRVGNDAYAKDNDSYGLTTLENRHVKVTGETLRFHFRGKSGVEHTVALKDKRLAKIVKRVRELPGQELFQYIAEDDARMPVHSQDVNEYIERIAGAHFTAKDFRTWEGTMYCALSLAANDAAETLADRKRNLVEAIAAVAKRLGNTPAVCKKSYIHPGVIDAYLESGALELVERKVRKKIAQTHALSTDEAKVVAFIEKLIARDEDAHLKSLLEKSVRRAKKRPSKA